MRIWKARGLLASVLVTPVALMAPVLVALSWFAAIDTAAADASPADGPDWAEGPVRWLMLPEDWKAYRQAGKHDRTPEFVAEFWARRDRPSVEGGELFREMFERRVDAADTLYAEGGIRGSLTDRGRAFILMGSPAHVRVSSEPTLAWTEKAGAPRRTATRNVSIETWGFRLEDLPAGLLAVAGERKRGGDEALSLTLTFRSDQNHTDLIEGESLLDLAARSYAHNPQD